jgi:low affinity Fe/Cu permease
MDRLFTHVANSVSFAAGQSAAFVLCCCIVLIWAVSGPFFGFSDTWQLVINTATTIVTFLMVFLIQNTQNRDAAAIQAKLDALIEASSASNIFVGIEHLPQSEVEKFRRACEDAARKVANDALATVEVRAELASERAT